MKWTTVTKATDIKLNGIKVEGHHLNKHLNSVILTDKNGSIVKFVTEYEYNDVKVQIPTPPEKKTVFEVVGTIGGVEVRPQNFDTKHEAENFIKTGNADAGLIITETEITVED